MKKILCYTISLLFSSLAFGSSDSTFIKYHSGKFRESAQNMSKLAKSGNKEAIFYLANMYLHGYGVNKNTAKGIELMTQAGKLNYLPALMFLGKYYYLEKHSVSEALPWFKQAAKKDNTQAQLFVILAYVYGYGVKANTDQARWSIIQAAKSGNAMAQYELARMFLQSRHYKSRRLGKIWLGKSARQGFKKAIKLKQVIDQTDLRKRYTPEKIGDEQLNLNQAMSYELMQKALQEANVSFEFHQPIVANSGEQMSTPKIEHLTKAMIIAPHYTILSPKKLALAKISTKMLRLAYLEQKPKLVFPKAPFTLPKGATNYAEALKLLKKRAVFGDPTVLYKLGQMYSYGLGVKKDDSKALHYFMESADQNYLLAQYEIGVFYLQGRAVPVNTETAISWLTRAALRGSPEAQFMLGIIYEFGINTPGENGYIKRNVHQAKALYNVSSLGEVSEAQYRLAQLYASGLLNPDNDFSIARSDQRKAYKLYKLAVKKGRTEATLGLAYLEAARGKHANTAELTKLFKQVEVLAVEGNSSAQLLAAIMYDRGIGVGENQSEAIDIFENLAKKGNSTAQFMLGTYEYTNAGNTEKAIRWLEKAAEQKNPYALYNLAILAKRGDYHPIGETFLSLLEKSAKLHFSGAMLLLADHILMQDLGHDSMKSAVKIFEKLADKQNSTAQLKLGYMYAHGIYFSKNLSKAHEYYKDSAKNHNAIAQYLLARQYQSGIGANKNINLAVKYFTKSADQGFAPAFIALGFCYEVYRHDYAKAFKLFTKAAEQKSAVAYYNLGNLYQYGKGIEKNPAEAFGWYQEAANKDYLYAELKLGEMYLKGVGVGQNSEQAIYWFKKAANKDNSYALYQLGLMYESGVVDNKINLAKAKEYYERAAKLGNPEAQVALARLNKGNTEQEIKNYKAASNRSAFAAYRLAVLNGKKINTTLEFCVLKVPNTKSTFFGKVGNFFSNSPNFRYMQAIQKLNQGKIAKGTTILKQINLKQPDFIAARNTLGYYVCDNPPDTTAEVKPKALPTKVTQN